MDGIYFGSYVTPSGAMTIDLSAASFSFSAKTIQNALTASVASPAFNFSAKTIQNTLTASVTSPAFNFSAQTLRNTLTASVTSPTFNFSAQTLRNTLTASVTSPTFNFDGQDILRGAVWFLSAASFGFDSTNASITQTVKPSAAALNLPPNAQNHTVNVQQDSPPTFDWVGQPLQNTMVLPLSVPTLGFIGKAIEYVSGATYPLTAAILNFSAKNPVPTLTIPLTAATLNIQQVGNLELLQDGVPMAGPLRLLPQVGVGL